MQNSRAARIKPSAHVKRTLALLLYQDFLHESNLSLFVPSFQEINSFAAPERNDYEKRHSPTRSAIGLPSTPSFTRHYHVPFLISRSGYRLFLANPFVIALRIVQIAKFYGSARVFE